MEITSKHEKINNYVVETRDANGNQVSLKFKIEPKKGFSEIIGTNLGSEVKAGVNILNIYFDSNQEKSVITELAPSKNKAILIKSGTVTFQSPSDTTEFNGSTFTYQSN